MCQVSYLGNSHWEGSTTVFLASKQNPWKISVKEYFYQIYILNSFYKIKSHIKYHICVYIIHFWFFFNTARESGKSYMVNHIVYFGLYFNLTSWSLFFHWIRQLAISIAIGKGAVYMRWDISPRWDLSPERGTCHPAFTWEKYPIWVRHSSS